MGCPFARRVIPCAPIGRLPLMMMVPMTTAPHPLVSAHSKMDDFVLTLSVLVLASSLPTLALVWTVGKQRLFVDWAET
jgi:hypothetical protein